VRASIVGDCPDRWPAVEEVAVSRAARSVSVAIAALIMAGAAAGAASVAPMAQSKPAAGAAAPAAAATRPAPGAATRGSSAVADAPGRVALVALFIGGAPALTPRTGVTTSFACRAAATMGWRCRVQAGAVATAALPAVVDVVVVATALTDDAIVVRRELDRLPAALRNSRTVILGPVTAAATPSLQRRVAALGRFAADRGAVLIDPVGGRWVTAATRPVYLTGSGSQLTAAGQAYVAARLSGALRTLRPPVS
jgi:hypothetical protein